jgi:hypothetical protein
MSECSRAVSANKVEDGLDEDPDLGLEAAMTSVERMNFENIALRVRKQAHEAAGMERDVFNLAASQPPRLHSFGIDAHQLLTRQLRDRGGGAGREDDGRSGSRV